MPRVLICYVKAGGGHFSNAKALKQKLNESYPKLEVELYDVLENSKFSFLDGLFNNSYMAMVNKMPLLWFCLTNITRFYPIALLSKFIFNWIIRGNLRKKIWYYEPDLVVSTYYFITDAVAQNIRKSSKSLCLVTLVTDTFSPHSIWFRVKNGDFIVSSQEAYFVGKKYIKDSSRIKRFGFIFNEKYNQVIPKNKIPLLKVKFGIEKHQKTILILGGGGGLKDADKIYESICKREKAINIIVVCGLNTQQEKKLLEISKGNKNAKIIGFTNCVQELINISDVVISKAGPSTVLETISQKKKIFLTSYIPDQEKGNKDFVVDNNLGFYSSNIDEVVENSLKYIKDSHEVRKFELELKKHKIVSDISNVADYLNQKSIKNIPYNKRI